MTMASMQKIRPLGTNASGTDVVVSFCLLIHPELRSSMNNNVQKLFAGSFFFWKEVAFVKAAIASRAFVGNLWFFFLAPSMLEADCGDGQAPQHGAAWNQCSCLMLPPDSS